MPSDVAPSKNSIVPVALPGETVAVSVIACPYVDGFSLDAMPVLVFAVFTFCVSPDDVLPYSVSLPLYTAVIV
jgi:hypothetical protein